MEEKEINYDIYEIQLEILTLAAKMERHARRKEGGNPSKDEYLTDEIKKGRIEQTQNILKELESNIKKAMNWNFYEK